MTEIPREILKDRKIEIVRDRHSKRERERERNGETFI